MEWARWEKKIWLVDFINWVDKAPYIIAMVSLQIIKDVKNSLPYLKGSKLSFHFIYLKE